MSGLMLGGVIVVVFCICMLLAVPVAFSLMAAALASIALLGDINLMVAPQQIFGGIDNLLLLAVCWELTSVSSYLLIGTSHTKAPARAAAPWCGSCRSAGRS